jgi:hypothetical protein
MHLPLQCRQRNAPHYIYPSPQHHQHSLHVLQVLC